LFAMRRVQPPFLWVPCWRFGDEEMLTDTAVKNLKSTPPRKVSDGGGLCLEVTSTGSKLWRVGYQLQGKQRTVYVKGAYPAVTLADARARPRQCQGVAGQGG
jgi:hypothetical protein